MRIRRIFYQPGNVRLEDRELRFAWRLALVAIPALLLCLEIQV